MAEHENGASAPEQPPARLQIITQFIRDLSFENIGVQKGGVPDGKPEVKVAINLDAANRGSDQYDVALKLKVDSHVQGIPLFILEIDYAGRFVIQGVPQEQMHPLLMIECPRLIFPFLRRLVSDITRDGGYPPLNLEMIDFMTLYRQEVAKRQAEATPKTANA
ncbi:protein-export chaperone SecB [Amaricoccus sp.]|uniref:protein-export chaperone SecB n=1 Tax=Amaricoccus sp. TaxID=1872485 RepID=UPI001B7C1DA4|nr:protein-export chaperone SecB [Amaricoccus sp.]MBP7240593.1 protein-export chaperone SecB [Amaricoccus sp.]